MDRHQFSAVVARLEREAEDSPRFYAFKVGVVAALGYLSILLIGASIVIASYYAFRPLLNGDHFHPKLAILCGLGVVTLFAMIRALWVKLDEPDGLRITRQQVPKLFAAIDEISHKMGRVPVHSVTVSGEFNAAITQIPCWGVFGNYRNHVEIGLPLAMALNVDELKAVLAHEMGHLSGAHGKFGAWIYRQRVTWHALESKFEDPLTIFDQILGLFYGWYAPYFYAYSFVLARQQEYEADRAAAQATSASAVASALVKLNLVGRFLHEVFWKRFFDQVEKAPEPPHLPHAILPRVFRAAEKEWSRRDWLHASLRHVSDDDDTHPSLSERLAALCIEPALPAHHPDRSALSLFEPSAASIVNQLDDQWRREFGPQWRERFEELHSSQAAPSVVNKVSAAR